MYDGYNIGLTLYPVMIPLGEVGGCQVRQILITLSFTAITLSGGLDAGIEGRLN